LGHTSSTVPGGPQAGSRATPKIKVGSPEASVPPDTWTESGLTPILIEII